MANSDPPTFEEVMELWRQRRSVLLEILAKKRNAVTHFSRPVPFDPCSSPSEVIEPVAYGHNVVFAPRLFRDDVGRLFDVIVCVSHFPDREIERELVSRS